MVEKNDEEENGKIVILSPVIDEIIGNFVAVENHSFQVRRGDIFAFNDAISLFDAISIGKSLLCVNQKMITKCATGQM
jgi:hypothetical protein